MSQSEQFDVLVLGSGTGGKLIAWHLALEPWPMSFMPVLQYARHSRRREKSKETRF